MINQSSWRALRFSYQNIVSSKILYPYSCLFLKILVLYIILLKQVQNLRKLFFSHKNTEIRYRNRIDNLSPRVIFGSSEVADKLTSKKVIIDPFPRIRTTLRTVKYMPIKSSRFLKIVRRNCKVERLVRLAYHLDIILI